MNQVNLPNSVSKRAKQKADSQRPFFAGIYLASIDNVANENMAKNLAKKLDLPLVISLQSQRAQSIWLEISDKPLQLISVHDSGNPVCINLTHLDTSSPAGRTLKQPLAKAIGLRKKSNLPLTVIDATAGYGEDTWLMASLGCDVWAFEKNPIVAALLANAIERAATHCPQTAKRIKYQCADAKDILSNPPIKPDIVYLDPMFPSKRKTAERKPLQFLRCVVGDDQNSEYLLHLARQIARKRVVVKRPSKAAALGEKPTCSHHGNGVRYDVYPII